MEITTYIENHTPIDLPPFKHPTKTISTQDPANRQLYYSENITFPDKIIIPSYQSPYEQSHEEIVKCYILFGYQLQLKDWELVKKLYPGIQIRIKLFRGNQVTQISDSVIEAKSFIKGQKAINEPERTLVKKDEKMLSSCPHMYVVQLIPDDPTIECTKVIYYLPSSFNKSSPDYGLDCIKYRYFNHKMLQILNEYVSLDNNNTSCYKDMAHHEFESTVYSGKVISFEVFIKLVTSQCNAEVCESFVEKLSQISMTDKHLLDEVDPLDFSEIKKEIRNAYLEQKRIRKSLTLDKLKIVQEIENALEFLNLKEAFCQKLTYSAITPEMLKKIRNQNIENKAAWIKQQNLIIKNLDARLIDLEITKQKHKQILLEQEKANSQQIQAIRNQIRELETNIRCDQAQKANQVFNQSIHMKNTSFKTENHSKHVQNTRASISVKKTNTQTLRQKQQLEELEKEKILKFEMIKAQFEMEKQFNRRKTEYAKAAEDLLNYLVDC